MWVTYDWGCNIYLIWVWALSDCMFKRGENICEMFVFCMLKNKASVFSSLAYRLARVWVSTLDLKVSSLVC